MHDSLARGVCNEILSAPNNFQTKVLIKVLTNLQRTHNNFVHLRVVKVLAELLMGTVKERSCVRSLEMFERGLSECLAKDPGAGVGGWRRGRVGLGVRLGSTTRLGVTTVSPTKKKRVSFSQSSLASDGYSLLNPENLENENVSFEEEEEVDRTVRLMVAWCLVRWSEGSSVCPP